MSDTRAGSRSSTPLTHELVLASAGSGKTFRLTTRYLSLLQRGVEPGAILATTFTRKAAGEILGRLLLRLARGAANESAARKLGEQLGVPALRLDDARAMLSRLCRGLDRVAISTIDSFFSRVTGAFRLELGLPPAPIIVAENDPQAVELRRRAIEAMLADDDTQTLVDLLRRLHHDSTQRSVTDAIDEIVSSLYDTYRQAPEAEAWQQLVVPAGELSETELASAIAALAAMESQLPCNKKGEPNKVWGKAWAKATELARKRSWDAFLGVGLAAKIASEEETFSSVTIDDAWRSALEPLVLHARADIIGRVSRRTLAMHDLITRFETHYDRLRKAQRLMLFSDLTHALVRGLPALGAEIVDDLYFRLDGRVGHILLDEFQDTSIDQWRVLAPLAQEIVSHGEPEESGRSFFCVGDMKQAIYGWRGGCAELFDRVREELGLGEETGVRLNKSYRSSPVVLDAVNQVFGDLAGNPALVEAAENARAWQTRFARHDANDELMPGYVELRTAPAEPGDDDRAPMDNGGGSENGDAAEEDSRGNHWRSVAALVGEIHRAAPGRSIGVLVSRHDAMRRVMNRLREAGLPASGEGGSPLTDDPAVSVVLSALTLADHPGDGPARFHIAHTPMARILGLTGGDRAGEEAARRVRRELSTHGYARTIARWAQQLVQECGRRSVQRLTQLIAIADAYDGGLSLRPADFVRHAEAQLIEEAMAAPIRVMTVHAAKGLEFDSVVLPELWRKLMDTGREKVFVRRGSPTGPIMAVHARANESERAMSEELEAAGRESEARRFNDDLCGLYVAMTRARSALYMVVPPIELTSKGKLGKSGQTSLSADAILRQSLSERPEENPAGDEILYQRGQRDWWAALPGAGAGASADNVSGEGQPSGGAELRVLRVSLRRSAEHDRRSRAVVTPSALARGGGVAAADLLAIDTSLGQQRGKLIHAWFECVRFIDVDGAPGADELRRVAKSLGIGADAELENKIASFVQLLSLPAIAEALCQSSIAPGSPGSPGSPGNGELELWRERPFAVVYGSRLLRGQFDRVVLRRAAGGKVTAAELLDFKSDRLGAGGVEGIIEEYRPQIEAYRAALAAMTGLALAAVRARLLITEAGRVVEVT